MLAVVYCHSCGLGGDAFALVWSSQNETLHGFNGSGRSPARLTIDLMRHRGHTEMPRRGPLAITVPGTVDTWAQLTERFGRRPLAEALLAAAKVAREGHRLTAINARKLALSAGYLDERARRVYQPGGRTAVRGQRLRQPHLSQTLYRLASDGAESFYRGEIAREIASAVAAADGVLSVDDMAAHRGEWVSPLSTHYRDVEVATLPPNSQGVTALMALNILESLGSDERWPAFDGDSRSRFDSQLSADRIHAELEALKIALIQRDRCVTEPERHVCDYENLLTRDHATELASRLSPTRASHFQPWESVDGGTVYLCTADADGMMVSLIQSNWMGFGSGITGGQTGVMLQNRGGAFSLDPDHPNHLAPRERPRHTLMPMMLFRGARPWVAMGTMGGDGQAQFVVQMINALLYDRLDPQAAVERPRFVTDVEGRDALMARVGIEDDAASPDLIDDLTSRGHRVSVVDGNSLGWAQMILREADGTYSGGADPRADSTAIGI